jgi:type VI secretion system secreted protein VgrG
VEQREKLDAGHYAPREYCVQYNESTFNFISRLLEHEGIHYFFRHTEKGHTIVFADGDLRHPPAKNYKNILFNEDPDWDYEHVWSWMCTRRMQPDRVAMKDYNFKVPQQCTNPRSSLLMMKPLPRPDQGASLEVFEYPGRYDHLGLGETYARIRTEEYRTRYETYVGQTNVRGAAPGSSFFLSEHPDGTMNREYLVTACVYKIEVPDFQTSKAKSIIKRFRRSDKEGGQPRLFECTMTAIKVDEKLRFQPARVTPKPFVHGPQTAVVTTTSKSEEIHTDEYGRVKVHFFWDRHNEENDKSSCWLRVSMPWAGKGWGGVQIPRKGQEVIVDFLEGDPDQPIITGRVYNAATMPPLSGAGRPGSPPSPTSMKAAAQQMSLRSNSLGQGGSAAKGNEITMNDDQGGETLFVHAEKDETHNVNHDRKDTVGNDEVSEVKHDRTDTVDNNETLTVKNNRSRTVNANETVTVALMRTHTVGINEAITIGAAQEITVGAAQTITVGAAQLVSVGAVQVNSIGLDRTTNVGINDSLTVGKKIAINAGDEILIQTGAAQILMKKDGTIAIKGKDISITGTGKIQIKASKDMILKAQKIAQN